MKRAALLLFLLGCCVPTYGQITFRGTGKAGAANNGNNVTLTFDTGGNAPQTGDTVIVCGGWSSSNGANPGISTSGYNNIDLWTTDVPINKIGLWYKVMGATPDTTVVTLGSGNGVDTTGYAAYVLIGVDAAITDATTVRDTPGTGTNPNPSPITTATNNALVIVCSNSQVNDASITAPSGYTNQVNANATDTNPGTIGMASINKATAGTETPATWTTWASGNNRSYTAAIKFAAGSTFRTQVGAFSVGP